MDTTKIADNIDGLADREFKTGGMKLSFGSIMAILAFLSTVVGGLYGGFVMYQKIEEVAGLDLGEYQQAMDVMDAKVTGISEKVEESVEYSRDIKNGLREDILSIEKQTDRVEDMVRKSEDKVRTMIDNAEVRFENQRERVRVSQSGAMKELEEKLDAQTEKHMDTVKELNTYKAASVFKTVSEGMVDTDVEKFKELVEDVDYDADEQYAEKLNTIKNSYFKSDAKEEVVDNKKTAGTNNPVVDGKSDSRMDGVMNAISHLSKK